MIDLEHGLDPLDALLLAPARGFQLGYEDPTDPEVTDPDSDQFVIPGHEYPVGEQRLTVVMRGGYEGARTCTGGPEPGSKNLMSVFLDRYASQGAKNLGIYNCRTVRGASTTSVHGEGRAGDHGCPNGTTWIQAWCDFLIKYSLELGVQCVIFNRRIWSSTYPDGWRVYTGLVPHTDHAHVEQTRASARTLTVERVKQFLVPSPPAPTPPPPGRRSPVKFGWNLPRGHYYGNIAGPAQSHGGWTAAERPFVQNIQQWLIYRGCVGGVPAGSWATSRWADGKWEGATDVAMDYFHRRFYQNQPQPKQCWSDDYNMLARA